MSTTKSWNSQTTENNLMVRKSNGAIGSSNSVVVGARGRSVAARQRPKPSVLTYTTFDSTNDNDVRGGTGQECGSRSTTWNYKGTGTHCWSNQGGYNQFPSADGAIALTKARANMSEFNFGESLVELDQTFNMVHGRMLQMLAFANSVRRGDWRSIRHSPSRKARRTPGAKRLANNWLELQFGWKPLVSDIYDIIDVFGRQFEKRGVRVYKRSSHVVTTDHITLTAKAGYGGVVWNEKIHNMNRLGVLNPALMVWNRIPMSFIVDWLVPVSTSLGSITAGAGLRNTGGWFTDHSASIHILHGRYCNTGEYIQTLDQRWVRRVAPPVFFPAVWVRKVAINGGRLATTAALIRQRT